VWLRTGSTTTKRDAEPRWAGSVRRVSRRTYRKRSGRNSAVRGTVISHFFRSASVLRGRQVKALRFVPTAARRLIHVDTELGAKDLLNSRMAYVAVSRGGYDAQIYTNNAATLGQELSRDVSHLPAIQQELGAHKIEPQITHTNQISQGFGLGL